MLHTSRETKLVIDREVREGSNTTGVSNSILVEDAIEGCVFVYVRDIMGSRTSLTVFTEISPNNRDWFPHNRWDSAELDPYSSTVEGITHHGIYEDNDLTTQAIAVYGKLPLSNFGRNVRIRWEVFTEIDDTGMGNVSPLAVSSSLLFSVSFVGKS